MRPTGARRCSWPMWRWSRCARVPRRSSCRARPIARWRPAKRCLRCVRVSRISRTSSPRTTAAGSSSPAMRRDCGRCWSRSPVGLTNYCKSDAMPSLRHMPITRWKSSESNGFDSLRRLMKTDRKLFLVTGAAGWIGRQVCRKLQQQGNTVAAFDRVATEGPWSEAFVGGLESFGQPPAALRQLLDKTAAVVHCAGRAHRPVETPEEVTLFKRTNVEGTRDLLSACRSAGIVRVVYVSTIAGYDWAAMPATGADEDAMLMPRTAYARTKLEGERLVAESR